MKKRSLQVTVSPATGPESELAAQPTGHVYETRGASRPVDGDPAELLRFSPRAREVASIIGVRHILTHLHLLDEEMRRGKESASLRLLAVRQELSDRLLLALFESSSIAAELECERHGRKTSPHI